LILELLANSRQWVQRVLELFDDLHKDLFDVGLHFFDCDHLRQNLRLCFYNRLLLVETEVSGLTVQDVF